VFIEFVPKAMNLGWLVFNGTFRMNVMGIWIYCQFRAGDEQ